MLPQINGLQASYYAFVLFARPLNVFHRRSLQILALGKDEYDPPTMSKEPKTVQLWYQVSMATTGGQTLPCAT